MPAERLSMRKIQEVLRLHAAGHSQQDISRSCGIGRSTVGEYLQRAREAGLGWPLPDDLDTAALERRLFPPALAVDGGGSRACPTGPPCTGSCGGRG